MSAPDSSPARIGVGTYATAFLIFYVGSFCVMVFVQPLNEWLSDHMPPEVARVLEFLYAPLIFLLRIFINTP